ncbi:MAG: DUF2934 domain-containing protein [Acidobacteriaceae bacterium]|nr:DUF2934 domain-containing protein [Acidobacteriaceae bacterium]
MLFNKASNKTRKKADENAAVAPEMSAAGEGTANPRASRSSKTKNDTGETGAAKRHRKASPLAAATQDNTPVEESATTPKTLAAAAGAETNAVASTIIDSAGVVTNPAATTAHSPENTAEIIAGPEVTNEQIAKLAYSYWIARGGAHGSQEEDWMRAERELRARR